MARIDGKYEELRELSRAGAETLLEVGSPQGETLRLGWFDVSTPAARASFHRYRAGLKALAPGGLIDVVARPGAYYSLWRPLDGQPLGEYLEGGVRDADTVAALSELAGALAAQGYALGDAEVVIVDGRPQVARLVPAERTPEDIEALNAPLLARLAGGRLRRRPRPRRAVRRQGFSLLGVLPGLLFLGGVAYVAPRAAQIYLNPPVHAVPEVTGLPAQRAADTLVKSGYRVTFADGESDGAQLGSVIGQSPEQGSSLHAGRLVTLTVNNPPPLTVPKVEELTLAQARAALDEVRLKVGEVMTIDAGTTGTPKGRVIAQFPEPGVTVSRGQPVRLLVSGGVRARQTWLPPLTGLSYEDARKFVKQAGLVIAAIRTHTSDAPENSVLAQSPAPYAKVDVGSPVTLTLAQAAQARPADPVPGLPLPPDPLPVTPETETPSAPEMNGSSTTPAQPGGQTPEAQPAPGTQRDGTPQDGTPQDNGPTGQIPSQPLAQPGQTPQDTTPQNAQVQRRSVQISYNFPTDLPAGNVEIVVRDLDGERVVLASQPSAGLAGNRAEGAVEVRGPARFSVRVDGQEVASFER